MNCRKTMMIASASLMAIVIAHPAANFYAMLNYLQTRYNVHQADGRR